MAARKSVTLFASQERVALPGSEKPGFSHPQATPGTASRALIPSPSLFAAKHRSTFRLLAGSV